MLKVVLATIGIIATMAAAQFSGGDGTENNPFIITTAEQLDAVRNDLNAHYKLGNDIMLNDTTNWQDWDTIPPENNWVAIGAVENRFNGTFDGNGFIVGGIYINSSSGYQGLFGFNIGTIKNLGVIASFVRGNGYVGGLVGRNNGSITNSHSIGNIQQNGHGGGGLVGENQNTGSITNSYSAGNVRGHFVGGLVGTNLGSIINSFSTASVSGNERVGGLVGTNGANGINGSIINSFSIGSVSGNRLLGGLVGMNEERSVVINSYYNFQTSGQNDNSGKGTPRNTAQMKTQNTFDGWDFESIWGMNANINNGYPYLRYFVDVRVEWGATTFTFNGEEQAPTATARFANGREVAIKIIGGETNAGTYTATAELEIPNPNVNLLNATKVFTINPKPLCMDAVMPIPVQQRTGNRIEPEILVMDGEKVLVEGVDYTVSYRDNIEALGRAIATGIGNYTGEADRQFRIEAQGAIVVNVIWGDEREFVFNKMVQHPEWSIEGVNRELFRIVNVFSQVGNYTAANGLAPFIFSLSENYKINSETQSVNYEITRRPLNVVMRDRNGNIRDTIVADTVIRISGDLFDYLESVLDYDNFATDTIRNETDDKNVLRGKPRFSIQDDDSQRSSRNNNILPDRNIVFNIGERFLVNVITDSLTADNYIILERKIAITIGERFITITTDIRDDDPVSISNIKKSDSRHGIKFTINPVSEKTEISVILPNNERAIETKIAVYDMTGNVVFSTASTGSATTATGGAIVWDLRNSAGRFVANGTYLVIAEVKDRNGKMYQYSARLGVRR